MYLRITKYKKSRAFTLAEVLITLLIIGVIASIVIPGLIQDSQNAELKTAWKKAYATASQAWKKAIVENGGVAPGQSSGLNDKTRWNAFKSQFSVTKDCSNYGTIVGNCWAKNTVTPDSIPGGYQGWSSGGQLINGVGFASADGMYWTAYNEGPGGNFYSVIAVDVNGEKGPNQWNKDVFTFALDDKGVGSPGSFLETGPNNSKNYLLN